MQVLTATGVSPEPGRLLKRVDEYCAAIAANATGAEVKPEDWEPVRRFIAPEFRRVGAYLEELDWDAYVAFLTQWAGSTRFEMTVFRVSEIGNVVVQEIEERHCRSSIASPRKQRSATSTSMSRRRTAATGSRTPPRRPRPSGRSSAAPGSE